MAIFEIIADYYDDNIVNGRFDHDAVVKRLSSFIEESPFFVADLASGTGNMANAVHKHWPLSRVLCEEPSVSMAKLLKKKFPIFLVRRRTLQETRIKSQDLVTIAFNSINYLKPTLLPSVFRRIRLGMNNGGIFYFDALTEESAFDMLNGKAFMEKTRKRGPLTIYSRLTLKKIFHRFSLSNGDLEEHTQYLISEKKYLKLLSSAHFDVLNVRSLPGTLRSEFICKSV